MSKFNFYKSVVIDNPVSSFTSEKIDWYKNKQGDNKIRLIDTGNDDKPSYLETLNHWFLEYKTDEGAIAKISPVCLNFLFSGNEHSNNLLTKALEANKISEKDFDYFQKKGCPICRINQALHKSDPQNNHAQARYKCFMLVQDCIGEDNDLKCYSASQTLWSDFFNQAKSLKMEDDISILDKENGRDFLFKFDKNGKTKAYTSMRFSPKSTREKPYNNDVIDLYKVWMHGIRDYETLTEFIAKSAILHKAKVEFGIDF